MKTIASISCSIQALCILLLTSFEANAQLKPPAQIDTLYIQSVVYNGEDIRTEYWPCQYIVKSMTSFGFGQDVFKIASCRERLFAPGLAFMDANDNELVFIKESDSKATVEYSGYEFKCSYKKTAVVLPKAKEGLTTGSAISTPNAHLTGRTVGTLPSPTYSSQVEGTVIVNIWVNQYGEVEKALIADETSVSDPKLLQAALNAAKKAHFSMKADAPVLQQGTITYNFKLK